MMPIRRNRIVDKEPQSFFMAGFCKFPDKISLAGRGGAVVGSLGRAKEAEAFVVLRRQGYVLYPLRPDRAVSDIVCAKSGRD